MVMYNIRRKINKLVSNKIFKLICAVLLATMCYDFLGAFNNTKPDIKLNNFLDSNRSHDGEAIHRSIINGMETKTNYKNNVDNWIWLNVKNGKVIARSLAYYDDRPLLSSTPCVRLYFLFSAKLGETFWKDIRFHFIYMKNSTESTETEAKKHFSINKPKVMQWRINNTAYMQHLVTIPLENSTPPLPKYIKISSKLFDAVQFEVYYPREDNPVHFAICVKPLYGYMDISAVNLMAEWFRLHKYFGVSEFHIYNSTFAMSNEIKTLFSKYNVKLVQFGSPKFSTGFSQADEFNFGILISRASYVDCIHKNYKRVKYLLIVDPDEIIVPRQHQNYTSMFQHLFNQPRYSAGAAVSISAQTAMFYKTSPITGETKQTLMYQKRAFFSGVFRPTFDTNIKSFINTRLCILPFHHHCLVTDSRYPLIYYIPEDVALTHHYRNPSKKHMATTFWGESNKTVTDRIMYKYKAQLEN